MSIGNPKKFRFSAGLEKTKKQAESPEAKINDIARVHKDKNYKVKKELSFTTNLNKGPLQKVGIFKQPLLIYSFFDSVHLYDRYIFP